MPNDSKTDQAPPGSVQPDGSALAWTHTKPTIGGLYLLREGPMTTPTMHYLVRNSESDKINILDTDSSYTFDDVEDLHDDYEWYGPIPWE
jgi:hypothetical protein